jgi:two-component system NtrC family sensor kinase
MSVRLLDTNRSAIGLLKVLLAGCMLLPLTLFVIASWVNYRTAVADAYRGLERSADVAREHAAKIVDEQSQVADRTSDLLRGMDADGVRRSEQRLHDALASMVLRLVLVQGVLVVGADGHPLVSAGVYPVPGTVDVSDRDYYQGIVRRKEPLFLSMAQVGSVNQTAFIGFAVPWTGPGGKLLGVIDVSVPPSSFEDFYAALAGQDENDGSVVTLVREDGRVLVRYPKVSAGNPAGLSSAVFMQAIAAKPDAGTYLGASVIDPTMTRFYAYRKVQDLPLYVVTGRSRHAVLVSWLKTVAGHLVFGIPATLALVAISWTALVRTGREERALAQARHEIERRERAEEALLRSQRLEAVGQMTGGVAHDFNNLLTIILGSAEMLERRPEDVARVRRVSGQIMLAAKRGGEITQQLLAFSRRQFVNPQTMNLNDCLLEFKPLLERASNESIRVEYDLQPDLYAARLDPGHFEAAILNLVGNARHAMPAGGRIVISTRNILLGDDAGQPDMLPGHYVLVGVTDNGTGMDPATAAKAFEPFFTTKGIGEGTGLGLSQVYGFAKQAGGDARISTSPGEGTTVELLLPRAVSGSELTHPVSPTASRAETGEVVLVVEDEPAVLATTVEILHDLGYGTIVADTAKAALARLQDAERVDVLFSDVTLPGGMDGLQLATAARRLCPGLRVLLTSGYAPEQSKLSDVKLLTKPYDRTQLAKELSAVLHGDGYPGGVGTAALTRAGFAVD